MRNFLLSLFMLLLSETYSKKKSGRVEKKALSLSANGRWKINTISERHDMKFQYCAQHTRTFHFSKQPDKRKKWCEFCFHIISFGFSTKLFLPFYFTFILSFSKQPNKNQHSKTLVRMRDIRITIKKTVLEKETKNCLAKKKLSTKRSSRKPNLSRACVLPWDLTFSADYYSSSLLAKSQKVHFYRIHYILLGT